MVKANTTQLGALDASILSGIFSASVIQEMAKKGKSKSFTQLARESGFATAIEPLDSLRNVFDTAFAELSKHYRNEYVYKTAITQKILLGRHSLNTSVMMTEFRVASCKADVVILNGTSTAYEIKSERDNLEKLPAQVNAYLQTFARVNVIGSNHHIDAILRIVPLDVGVLQLTAQGNISIVREPVENPGRIIPTVVFDALQLHEAKKVLHHLGVSIPDVPNTLIYRKLHSIFEGLAPIAVHNAMVEVLKTTRSHKPTAKFIYSLPKSLRALTIASKFRHNDQARLCSALDSTMADALLWG